MYLDFPDPQIVLRPSDVEWGPYQLDISSAIPSDVIINSVNAESFLRFGLNDFTAKDIVEDSPISIIGDTSFQVYLKGNTTSGRYYIKFTFSLSNGSTKALWWGPIVVENSYA